MMEREQSGGVDVIVLERLGELRTEVDLAELPHHLSNPRSLIWCDITGTEGGQQGPYGRLLREVFGFDELTIEDSFTRNHLPKVDIYDDYLFVAFFSFHLSEKRGRVETVEVDMYIGENYVVCIHPRPLREFERVRRRLLSRDEFVTFSSANVAHTVFDAIVDEYLPIMNRLSRFERIDVVIAMAIAGAINASMLILAAALFHANGLTGEGDIDKAFEQLKVLEGNIPAILFALALLASGFSSSSVGTMSGQVVMQCFINRRIPLFLRRLITMLPSLTILAMGINPSRALVISQVVLSFGIPFALIPLLIFCRNRNVMGALVNHRLTTAVATVVVVLIVSLNVFLIYRTFFS